MDADDAPPQDIALRQLRHHTRNALQRILADLSGHPVLRGTRAGQRVLRVAEQRILQTVAASDALFGLTRAPEPLEARLRALCAATVELMADPDQVVDLRVDLDGGCPPLLEEALFGAAHELVGNAVKHGLRGRMLGRVAVRLDEGPGSVLLVVEDDGWGPAAKPAPSCGEGLGLVRALVEQHGGRMAAIPATRLGGLRVVVELPAG